MKTAIVENSAPTHAPFSTVVYEQSTPDRYETGPAGQPRLLPRETLHHLYLRDVATGQQTRLAIAATQTIARAIAAKIEHGRLPAALLALGEFRYAVFTDAVFPSPEAVFPEVSGGLLRPLVYEWSPPDQYDPGDDGQPVRRPPQTLYNLWASDPARNLCGFLCTVETRATAWTIASSLRNCRLPLVFPGTGQHCCAVWTVPLSISPLARPALGTC